jgi:hypothetical protein
VMKSVAEATARVKERVEAGEDFDTVAAEEEEAMRLALRDRHVEAPAASDGSTKGATPKSDAGLYL